MPKPLSGKKGQEKEDLPIEVKEELYPHLNKRGRNPPHGAISDFFTKLIRKELNSSTK